MPSARQKVGVFAADPGADELAFHPVSHASGGPGGVPDSIWIDLTFPTGAGLEKRLDLGSDMPGTTPASDSSHDPLPVLLVVADQQDFYF